VSKLIVTCLLLDIVMSAGVVANVSTCRAASRGSLKSIQSLRLPEASRGSMSSLECWPGDRSKQRMNRVVLNSSNEMLGGCCVYNVSVLLNMLI
jgi:hypothetical protein